MSMDITNTLEPDSSQINADDLIGGPITVTVREVSKGNDEQPVNIHLLEYPDRAYRPSKTMRRLIASAWGVDAAVYAGRRLTLYRNPDITFGREKVGGIEVSALSHIDKILRIPLTVSRGKRRTFTVEPLPDVPGVVQRDWAAEIEAADTDTLRNLWHEAPPEYQPAIQSRAELLKPTPAQEQE